MESKSKQLTDFDLRVRYRTLALRTKIKIENPNEPLSCSVDHYKLQDRLHNRLRIVLHSNGCSLALCTMCPIPNEAMDPTCQKVTAENYINQVEFALKKYANQSIISIYNENFFSEQKMPREARREILRLVKENDCEHLIIGAHPIFISRERLQEAKDILGNKTKLLIGIGLQSADDEIRKTCIRTPMTKEMFLTAHRIIHEFGYGTKGYILLKPPFLLQEEAIIDTVTSAIWLHENGIEDITICLTRISKGTVLRDLFEKKLYSQPKLTATVECLDQLQQKNISARASVFTNDSPELETIPPQGCELCEEKILRAIKEHNDLVRVNFKNLKCPNCWEVERNADPKEFSNLSFQERVAYWLDIDNK